MMDFDPKQIAQIVDDYTIERANSIVHLEQSIVAAIHANNSMLSIFEVVGILQKIQSKLLLLHMSQEKPNE